MRLDVALMDCHSPEFAFDDDVGCLETGFHIAAAEFVDRCQIRRFSVAREERAVGGVGDRSALGDGLVDGEDRWQRFVVDFYCGGSGGGLGCCDRGHCGDDMAVVQRFVARHQVDRGVEFGVRGVEIGKIGAGHDCFHSRHRFGLAGVDLPDPGVSVR